MTRFAGISVLRRKFSLPIALSVGFHGLAAAALGTFALTPPVQPMPSATMTVSLIAPTPARAVSPEPAVSLPAAKRHTARKVRHAAVKRSVRRPVASILARSRSVSTPSARPVTALAPQEAVAAFSEPQAEFMTAPRVLAPAAPPAAASAAMDVFALPESTDLLDQLAPGVGTVVLNRSLPMASYGGPRLLRDTAAESGTVRSKVRAGNNPRPDYPRTAREAGWEGTVVLQVLVLPDGTAGAVTLHKTSGYGVLDEAALSAVKDWRFIPAMDGNFPVRSVVRLPVRFDLKSVD